MATAAPIESSRILPSVAGKQITEFIDKVVLKRGTYIPGSRLQQAAARLVPANSRVKVRMLLTDALSPLQRRKADSYAHRGNVRLHLGSGELPRESWVNLDLLGVPVDVAWNLHRRLPFRDNSVDAVFHEHVLEHLPMDRGLALISNCYRVLKPGGILRIAVPNVRFYLDYYTRGVTPEGSGQDGTPLMRVLQEFYGHGHQTMYDFETLALLCHAAGFPLVERRAFGESGLSPCPDHEWREWDSLYAEMVK